MQKAMNRTLDPCRFFYEYVCGNWERAHPGAVDTFQVIEQAVLDTVNETIKNARVNPFRRSATERVTAAVQSCWAVASEKQENLAGLSDFLRRHNIDLPPTRTEGLPSPIDVMMKLNLLLNIRTVLFVQPELDLRSQDRMILTFHPNNNLLKEFLTKVSTDDVQTAKHIFQHMKRASGTFFSWMDNRTRALALRRFDKLSLTLGVPRKFYSPAILEKEYAFLPLFRGTFLEELLSAFRDKASITIFEYTYGPKGQTMDRDVLSFSLVPPITNAYFFRYIHTIYFPTVILAKPLLVVESLAATYGSFGSILGHEIGHAFDPISQSMDPGGGKEEWMSSRSRRDYQARIDCVIRLYDATGVRIDTNYSVATLNENFADILGLQIALAALESDPCVRLDAESPLKGFTNRQLFYILPGDNRRRKILGLVAFQAVILSTLSFTLVLWRSSEIGKHETKTQESTLELMQKAMNRTLDPCRFFYEYVCGNWERAHPGAVDTFQVIEQAVLDTVNETIKNARVNPFRRSATERVTAAVQSCWAVASEKQENLAGLSDFLRRHNIDLPPTRTEGLPSPIDVMMKLNLLLNIRTVLFVQPELDLRSQDRMILTFHPNNNLLKEFLTKVSTDDVQTAKHIFQHMKRASGTFFSWMDNRTRALALRRFDKLSLTLGVPRKFYSPAILEKEYAFLPLFRGTFLEELLSAFRDKASITIFEYTYGPKGQTMDRDVLSFSLVPPITNAYFFRYIHTIYFPTVILAKPLLVVESLAATYGSFGSILGHEIGHAFDPISQSMDPGGGKEEWMSSRSRRDYQARIDCVIRLYDATGVRVDTNYSVATLNENFADILGLQIALAALESDPCVRLDAESPLKGFTNRQLFYVSFCNQYCAHGWLAYNYFDGPHAGNYHRERAEACRVHSHVTCSQGWIGRDGSGRPLRTVVK
ncbi:neprilysin-1-like [Ixodes scapularis]